MLSHVQFFAAHGLSPPGSAVCGILQARILEWVVISFSRVSSWFRDRTHVSCLASGFFTTVPPGKPFGNEISCLLLWFWHGNKTFEGSDYFLSDWLLDAICSSPCLFHWTVYTLEAFLSSYMKSSLVLFSDYLFIYMYIYIYIYIYLFGCTGSSLWHVGSSFLTRDQTQASCVGSSES